MDRVSESLLNEFSADRGISQLEEYKRFEHFTAFITIGQHYANTFDTEDVLVGSASGIYAIATIINGNLITDVESIDESYGTGDLDVTFIFVQCDRGAGFDAAKIGNFGFAVSDFFKEQPTLPRNDEIKAVAEIMSTVYKNSSRFTRGNPICRLYYATTGKWTNDQVLETRRSAVIMDLEATNLFREVTFTPLGAEGIQRLYRQTKNAIGREFQFRNRIVIPEVPDVTEAYLGYLPMPEFVKILSDENGEIVPSLFYSNPRDWQNYNVVNSEIKATLESDEKSQFVLMNNGVTIIARNIRPSGDKFFIEDYQIVNGCQTSHVLFERAKKDDATVMVPVRLIGTTNEDVINSIIRATNRQTLVTEDQFFALQEFPKQLEAFFQAFPIQQRLYFERRSNQYSRLSIEKTRIITQPNVIKSFAAMFLNEPHRTTRNYGALKAKVGKEIFGKDHRTGPYYTAAFALYKLEYFFRSGRLEAKFKPARFHILLAIRLLGNPKPLPVVNSHDMENYCKELISILSDEKMEKRSDELITRAAKIIESAATSMFNAENIFHRDNIRTEPFTKKVIEYCKAEIAALTQKNVQ